MKSTIITINPRIMGRVKKSPIADPRAMRIAFDILMRLMAVSKKYSDEC
jgi:hypothetical protein